MMRAMGLEREAWRQMEGKWGASSMMHSVGGPAEKVYNVRRRAI